MTPAEAITELLSQGLTEAEIGAKVGTHQGTINKIKRGDMTPNWVLGEALVGLVANGPAPDEAKAAA